MTAEMKPRHAGRGRLTRSAEFERVYRQGRSFANRHLALYVFPNPETDDPRVGLSVSRKVGGAVQRNRVKRLLREAAAALGDRLGAGCDFVVVARPDVLDLIELEGQRGVQDALADLLAKAHARAEPASQQRRRAA